MGLNIFYEKNVTGGTTTVTKHFYAGGLQVAKMVGSTVYYLHQDALGSTRLVATATVTIKFSSNYVPYGNNYAVSGKEVYMYTGKPQDSNTGLYYFGARYYDTTTGRFVTQDSQRGNKNDPMTMNLYIYARDNPERYVDTNGHMFAGRSWTDSNDPAFLATLTPTLTPGGQTAYLAPDYSDQTSSKTKLDQLTWFTTTYVKSRQFVADAGNLALDVLTAAVPTLRLFSQDIKYVAGSAEGKLLFNANGLASAILSRNTQAVAVDIADSAFSLVQLWWNSASPTTKAELIISTGLYEAGDAAVGGAAQIANDLVTGGSIAWDIATMYLDEQTAWAQYQASGG
ncbi:MAG TPA: RHS repeat-associated core domain-containing protein [Nitrososphaerales archaeon]|nr:RHS repeat-associated core domain-containing protein [Nitrososphaerales archaeon]